MVAVAQCGSSGGLKDNGVMPQNFLSCEREQVLLMPLSLRDWLPEDHLAWFILASVEELDLRAFYDSYRGRWSRAGRARSGDDGRLVVVRPRARATIAESD
jgi:hypothetical protein